MDLLFRFLVGGIVVSLFAGLGDGLKPKSVAGLMSAAPSVALATLSLTVWKRGATYAATEAQSMIFGAVAFLIYAYLVSILLMRLKWPVLPTTAVGLLLWLAIALSGRHLILG